MNAKRLGALTASLALTLSLTTPLASAAAFSDVSPEDWFYKDITKMADLGMAKGYDDGTYKPTAKMFAVECLLFCARVTGIDNLTQDKIAEDLSDEMVVLLPPDMFSWASREMAVALEAGILSYDELMELSNRGDLMKAITREDICKYLVRAMQLEPLAKSLSNYPLSFDDADQISPELQPYIYVLQNFGIIKGNGTGSFDPKGLVDRAQMTTMLSRALDFMNTYQVKAELPEYTDYQWTAGTISSVTSNDKDSSLILNLTDDIAGNQSFTLDENVKIYKDNMITENSRDLRVGQYVRLRLGSTGKVKEVRLLGLLFSETAPVSSVDREAISIQVNGVVKTYPIDRFTQVMTRTGVGDRELIDPEAGYRSAVCYLDSTGHLAGIILEGGTEFVSGLIESVVTANGTVTMGVTQPNGVLLHYTVPVATPVTVDGKLGSLSKTNVGDYVQLRVDGDKQEAVSIAVDDQSIYLQGPIKRLGTKGSAKVLYMTDPLTGKEISYNISFSAVLSYEGKPISINDLESGWYATVKISNNLVTQLQAFPGSTVNEGRLDAISYGPVTELRVVDEHKTETVYRLDLNDLPAITRNGKNSSIDQLRTGDQLVVTVRYNKVAKIDATSQTADLTGTITSVNLKLQGIDLVVTLADGSTRTFAVGDGVTVTQDGANTTVSALKPGDTVAIVTNGDAVVSIEITEAATPSTQITGTVLTVQPGSVKTVVVLVKDPAGNVTPVTVDAKNAKMMDQFSGNDIYITALQANDPVVVYGSYEGAAFVATIIIRQK